MRFNSQMDLHQSPIKIVCNVNIPDVGTPTPSEKSNWTSHCRKSTLDGLQTQRTEILLLKDAMQYQLAFLKVNQLIRNYPRDVRALQLKAEITFLMGQFTIALQIYQKLLDQASSYENVLVDTPLMAKQREFTIQEQKRLKALYLYNKALCLQKLRRPTEAVQPLKESLEINRSRLESYVLLAELYRENGQLQKGYKIYRKIIEKSKKREYLFKAIRICQQQNNYEEMLNFVELGLAYKRQQTHLEDQEMLSELLKSQGEALKKLQRYEQAIQVYHRIIEGQLNESKLVKIYNKLALCYDFTDNLPKACEYYKKILLINESSMQTINNLANLQLRRKHYLQAINLLNSGLLKALARSPRDAFLISLLRSHRVIGFASLGLIAQAKQDLNEIIKSMKESKQLDLNHQQDWQNFKFMRSIVQRYEKCSDKIDSIKMEAEGDCQQVSQIERQLVCSISESLAKPFTSQTAKQNLQELSSRIDRLYNEIVAFKKSTLTEHQQNADKVHNKIAEIELMLNKKDEQTVKLEKQLQELKQENQSIYNFVLELRQTQDKQFGSIIAQLRKDGKLQIVGYLQAMYWTFNVYFISIRLVASGLAEGKQNFHLSKVSSFFAKFKKTFETASKLPHIGMVCDIINSVISLYLSQESNLVYKGLNEIVTKKYYVERDLEKALQSALANLSKTDYIQNLFKNEKSQIANEMNLYNKAKEWFRGKRNKLIQKVFKVQINSTQEQRFIQQSVIEDVSATFVYLVKNKSALLSTDHKSKDVLFEAIEKTLVQGFKKSEISSLYAKETGESVKKEQQGEGCSKCLIYKLQPFHDPFQIQISKNTVMNALIAEALEQNNLQLLLYAAGQITFNFR